MKKKKSIVFWVFPVLAVLIAQSLYAFQADIKSLPGLLEDLERMAGKSNVERLEALKEILSEKGIEYQTETFSAENRRGSYEGTNLIVTIGSGENDIIVGAHYDKVDIGSGVVDNGASSIILTRLAEALKDEAMTHRVRIVWFDIEERGLVGSAKFIEAHKDDPIVSMINLDVNGYGDTMMFGPTASTGLNRLYTLARSVCAKYNINYMLFPAYGAGDDISFQKAGIENISIGIGPAVEVREFWLAMNGVDALKPSNIPVIFRSMHSENDAMNKIQPEALSTTYTVVLEMIKVLDKMKNE